MIVGLTPTVIIVRTAIHYCRSTLASNPMISLDFLPDGEQRGHFLTDSVPIKDFPASFPGGGIFSISLPKLYSSLGKSTKMAVLPFL